MDKFLFEDIILGIPIFPVVIIITLICFIIALIVKSYKKKTKNTICILVIVSTKHTF